MQAQWGFHGLVVSRRLVHLEVAVNATIAHVEDDPNTAVDSLFHLRSDINEQVATPSPTPSAWRAKVSMICQLREGRN